MAMPEIPIPISAIHRRRFILGKQGLWPQRRWAGEEGTEHAIQESEAIQIDPVSVISQSHHIALWGRVDGYRPEFLDTLAYKERKFFDYGGTLMMYPMQELPYWRTRMERAKSWPRVAAFAQANPHLLNEVRHALQAQGPLRSRDFNGSAVDHYRAGKDTGVALYYLWLTGELMTHARQGNERIYGLTENIAPAAHLWTAEEDEAQEFFIRKAISHLGLVSERRFRSILSDVTGQAVEIGQARQKLADMLADGKVSRVALERPAETLYFLPADLPALQALTGGRIPDAWQPAGPLEPEVVFLSPLEIASARGRAKELFGFNYVWEIYKPAAQRQYGPYTLPVLYGDRLVARTDLRVDRPRRTLVINGFWLEDDFAPNLEFAQALARGFLRFSELLSFDTFVANGLASEALSQEVARCLGRHEIEWLQD